MRLIIDENVPVEVASFFRERGHEVIAIAAMFERGLPDIEIARYGNELAAIVVTWDKDFERLIERVPLGNRRRFRRLGRLSFLCRERNGRRRAEALIDSIEFEYALAERARDRRLIIEISETSFRVVR